MISGEKLVYLVNVDEGNTDNENGDREKAVSKCKGLVAFVDLVGVQTLQLGQSQGIEYSFSIEIPRIYYDYEKYCFFDNQLYEIKGLGKAKISTNMLLNISKSNEQDVKDAIIKWKEEN